MAEHDEGAGKEFSAETPLGKINLKGYHLGNLLQIAGVSCLVLIAFMVYEAKGEDRAKQATSKSEHDLIETAIKLGVEAQIDANYIATLSQERKEKLNLEMPESMRRKLARER